MVSVATIFKLFLFCREILTLKDGGEVALDWLEKGCDSESPVIIILPGLTGECLEVLAKFSALQYFFTL